MSEGWLYRLKKEHEDLKEKLEKLSNILCKPNSEISERQLKLMHDQYRYMNEYLKVLDTRILDAEVDKHDKEVLQ